MNRKTVIIILSIVGVICLCAIVVGIVFSTQAARFIGQSFSADPAKASQVAHKISDYTLPSGYKEALSMEMFGVTMAGISSSDEKTVIMLFQFPKSSDLSRSQMEEQMKQLGTQQSGQRYNLDKVGSENVSIRGKTTQLSIYEGSSDKGVKIRQEIAVFDGKDGTAFLMVTGPVESWDPKGISSFIASMR